MQPAEKKHIVRWVVLTLLLAAMCIGLCELAVCRFEDPQLYHMVVDPAIAVCRKAAHRAGEQAQAAARQAGARLDAVSRHLEERALQVSLSSRLSEETAGPLAPALPEGPAGAPAVALTYAGGQELLSGGPVPVVYFNQSDPAWAERRFGNDPIDAYGCGPTAMAMAVSTLTGETVDPSEMAAVAADSGYCAPGQGSYLSIVPGLARHYGLNCALLPARDPGRLEEALSSGGIAVALMGAGHFTRIGHFILLHGLTPDGRVLAADPNSRPNSLTPWDPGLILKEAACLWLISPSEAGYRQ